MSDHAEFLRSWAADIRASSGQSVDADRLDAIAAELTRLQKELETAREALEAVASILPKYAMKGDTASDDEALDAVLETVMDATKGGRE